MATCVQLKQLPFGFGGLHSLSHLDLGGCCELKSLPYGGGLNRLLHLSLHGCYQLRTLPKSFGNLGSLRILVMAVDQRTSIPATHANRFKLCPHHGLMKRSAFLPFFP